MSMPGISWTHDGLNVTGFYAVTDTDPAVLLNPTKSGTTYTVPIIHVGSLSVPGQHALIIQAVNADGTTPAPAATVVKL
ncbi:MAG: hypothetical protein MUF84_12070 [Anaerolineae bacterium]|nr:hypothetical protein [Anaerolineae bacterium]